MADGQATPALPVGELGHSCPGRTRFAFPALKGDAAALEAVRSEVARFFGVVDTQIRPVTGSLIVAHWGTAEDLIEEASSKGVFVVGRAPDAETVEARARQLMAGAEGAIGKVLGNGLDARSLAALAFAAMAIRQIAIGTISPPAATALWSSAILLLAEKGLSKLTGAGGLGAD